MKAILIPALLTALLTALLAVIFPVPSLAGSVIAKWEKIYSRTGYGHWPAAMAVDGAGNVVVIGGIDQSIGNESVGSFTAKYAAADGALLWEKRQNPSPPSNPAFPTVRNLVGLAVDPAGNIIATGTDSDFSTAPRFYTVKYAGANGALLWEKRSAGAGDEAIRVAVDGAGNVIVTGISGTYPKVDFYTVKYAAGNGALLWERRYNGPGNSIDRPQGMAVDSAGNVFVTGNSRNPAGSAIFFDFHTAKYAAADGALLWEKRYQGPGNDNTPTGLVVDRQGNAVVTGISGNPSSGATGIESRCTVKYAAADGTLLWEKRTEGPDGIWERRADVALDDGDNVITTGNFSLSADSFLVHLAKYAAADGALLWEKSSHAFGSKKNAVDHAGNVIVTGSAAGSGGKRDLFTAMLAAADGALLWEKRYQGTGNLDDYGSSLAVDSSGDIIVAGGINYNDTDSGGTGDTYIVKYVPSDGDDDGLLDSWEKAHFGGTAGQSALDDTDRDGAVELIELAFGTDPRKAGPGAGSAIVVENQYLTTSITKQPGVTYLVQTSGSAGAGFSAADTTVLTDTATTLKVRDNIPTGTRPARFLRVLVTAAP